MSARDAAGGMSQQSDQAGTRMPTGEAARRVAPPLPRRAFRYTHSSGERPLDGYTIKRGIGVGGFGEVYFAISDAGKEVALKRIQRNLDIELRGVRQCLNLKHMNLISLWDIRTGEQGESWVVMEYVPGHSLRDVLQQHRQGMLEADVRKWFLPVCAGVCYLHDRGIVHRDLKPGNIFYDSDEQLVKIGDYGLSKFMSCSQGSGHTESVGTFHYMAPEIGRGVYGKGIDIYALGVILFEMLTGELPFDGESTQEIIMKHLTSSPDLRRVPGPLREVVETALAKDPDARFANVRELIAALPWEEARTALAGPSMAPAVPPVSAMGGKEAPTAFHPGRQRPDEAGAGSPAEDGIFYIGDSPEDEPAGISMGPVTSRTGAGFDVRRAAPVLGGFRGRSVSGGGPGPARSIGGPVHGGPIPGMRPGDRGEPVSRFVRSGFGAVVKWFQEAPLATPLKVLIAAAVILTLAVNSAWLLPLAIVLGLVYLFYFAIRSWVVQPDDPVTPVEKQQIASEFQAESVLRSSLGRQPWTDRLIELFGSMLLAGVCCAIAGLVCLVASGGLRTGAVDAWARLMWLACVCLMASWSVLVASKAWESRTGNPWQRRVVMAGLGMGLGLAAFALGEFLMLTPSGSVRSPGSSGDRNAAMFARSGPNQLAAYLTVFAAVFGLLRWWRMADPVRKTRVSLWGTGLCTVVAALVSSGLDLDPFWPSMVALITSLAVQVAAPWAEPADRQRALAIAHAHPRNWQGAVRTGETG